MVELPQIKVVLSYITYMKLMRNISGLHPPAFNCGDVLSISNNNSQHLPFTCIYIPSIDHFRNKPKENKSNYECTGIQNISNFIVNCYTYSI